MRTRSCPDMSALFRVCLEEPRARPVLRRPRRGCAQVVKDLVFNRAVLPCSAAARAPAHAAAGGPGDAEPMET